MTKIVTINTQSNKLIDFIHSSLEIVREIYFRNVCVKTETITIIAFKIYCQ